jgi:AbrB family looped-hinge helix DNA binding protein
MKKFYLVTSGGKVTIPAHIRRKINLSKGAKITFEIIKDGIMIRVIDEKRKCGLITLDKLIREYS